jgi:hypothetical protein
VDEQTQGETSDEGLDAQNQERSEAEADLGDAGREKGEGFTSQNVDI